GEGPLARLQDHLDGDRFRALRQPFALVDVEYANLGDEGAFGALRRLDDVPGANAGVDHECEIPLDRHEVRAVEFWPGLGLPRLWRGNCVEDDLEGDDRPLGVERFQGARMQLTEPADDGLRPELQPRRAARMKKRRTARDDLDRVRALAE